MAQPTNYGFNEDAAALKDVAIKFFRDKFSANTLHNLVAKNSDLDRKVECNWDQALWQEIIELGWLMTAVPERVDGLGMPVVAVASLVEQAGLAAFPSPLLATLSSTYILSACESNSDHKNADDALRSILDGKTISYASCNQQGSWEHQDTDAVVENNALDGCSYFVQDAKKVDYFLVKAQTNGETGLYLVHANAEGLTISPDTIYDLTRDQATLHFDNVSIEKSAIIANAGTATPVLKAATPALLVLLTADMCGAAEWQLQTTAEYAKTRVQFDKPIGFFQAVKHPLAEFMVGLDQARSHLYNAACAIDHEPELAEKYARMAKAVANEMAIFGSSKSVQLHGGIGFTWECYIHMYMKRQMHSQLILGDAYYQRAKIAETLFA